MGRYTFNLPDIGEGIAEAELVAWHVKVGDRVEEDDKLADVMTDKATVEMESPVSGVVVSVAGAEGDMLAIGAPLVVIETDGEGEAEEAAAPAPTPAPAPQTPPPFVSSEVETPQAAPAPAKAEPAPEPRVSTKPATNGEAKGHAAKVLASPAVRARAAELGIDLGEVKPAEDARVGEDPRHARHLVYRHAFFHKL